MPRPAPDLVARRARIVRAATGVAESEGWAAVTMRRIAGEVEASQPVLYSVFAGRQALIDAIALEGFGAMAAALEGAEAAPLARMRAYLDFAAMHPTLYEAMFSMPSDLPFAEGAPEPLARAFSAIQEVFPAYDEVHAEVAWSTLHGLATLQAGGRLPGGRAEERLEEAHRVLTARSVV